MLTPLPPLRDMLAWLSGQPWEKVIGRRVDCHACPLAVWLSTVYPGVVTVDEDWITLGTTAPVATPWAYLELVLRIDYAGLVRREVTVEEAYSTLQALLSEQGEG